MGKKRDADRREQKIQEALEVLEALGLPRRQQNERSALTLLSLLGLLDLGERTFPRGFRLVATARAGRFAHQSGLCRPDSRRRARMSFALANAAGS